MAWVNLRHDIAEIFAIYGGKYRKEELLERWYRRRQKQNKDREYVKWLRWKAWVKTGTSNPNAISSSREYYREYNKRWLAAIKTDPAKMAAYRKRKAVNSQRYKRRKKEMATGKIADQARKNLAAINAAKAKGSLGPFAPAPAKKPTAAQISGRTMADRKSQEASLGLTRGRKAGYTGD